MIVTNNDNDLKKSLGEISKITSVKEKAKKKKKKACVVRLNISTELKMSINIHVLPV